MWNKYKLKYIFAKPYDLSFPVMYFLPVTYGLNTA